MADPQRGDDEFPEDDEGSESTVSMSSPMLDGSVPSPVSVPPPAGPPGHPPPQISVPTSPAPFTPQTPAMGRGVPPKPLPAAGAPPPREMVTSGQATGAAGGPAGMKRPQTVIGLAPPPVGSPRPGQAARPGAGGLPPKQGTMPVNSPRPPMGAAAVAPASDRNPPSSGRGVRPPSSPRATGSSPRTDADSTDEQFALPENPRDSIPDSQKEDFATMAKSPEESMALFGLDPGPNQARSTPQPTPPVGPKPPSNRSPLASTNLAQPGKAPARPGAPPPLPPSSQPKVAAPAEALPALHDRSEEEESTRAVSREEMLRGHDAVIIGEDSEGAQGEDATLALSPGLNEAAHLTALAETLDKKAAAGAMPPAAGAPPPVQNAPPPPPGFDPNFGLSPPPAPPTNQNQGWQQPPPPAPPPTQNAWQDPNAFAGVSPGAQSYPGMSVGPVSGPHLPAQSWTPNAPPSQPHFPAAPGAPQSQPNLSIPQSGQPVSTQMAAQPAAGGPIPYPGQPNIHQPPPNPFGDWNANAPPPPVRKSGKGQIILLGVVGVVCLSIFIIGIVLFATTKF